MDLHIFKDFFYNWFGYNQLLFLHIHGFFKNKLVLKYFQIISEFGQTGFIPVYFTILIVSALASKNSKTNQYVDIKYAKAFCVLFFGFLVGGFLVDLLKTFFAYTRPLCTQHLVINTNLLSSTTKCFESFPSGHASAVALAVFALWPIFNIPYRILGIVVLVSVMIARILKAAHYPADVLYGAAIGYLLAFLFYKGCSHFKTMQKIVQIVQKTLAYCKKLITPN